MLSLLSQQNVLIALAVGAIILALMFLIPAVEELVCTYTPLGEFCERPNMRWAVVILTIVAVLTVVVI
ncbi:hypothetical protein [Bifidobacterium catenulatum]|uniref:hypothetical protein n=1 Tax=Bifidobacterium catenulatum TaxID=1686 RepID=UPI0034A2B4C4